NGLMEIKCDFTSPGFTMILHRTTRCLSTDFNRTKHIYSSGFGQRFGNYWLGLQNIFELIQIEEHEYHIRAVKTTEEIEECTYSTFKIENASANYVIDLGTYKRPPGGLPLGDSMSLSNYNINGKPFSTYDRDFSGGCPADRKGGGWWY
ncbi:hypothetical protein LOTGIDRAFT_97780, partial [Lottia gigantea]